MSEAPRAVARKAEIAKRVHAFGFCHARAYELMMEGFRCRPSTASLVGPHWRRPSAIRCKTIAKRYLCSYSSVMDQAKRTSIGARVADLADAQQGYFTRSQASGIGIGDMDLQRAVRNRAIERLDHGVYRISGAGQDPHQRLRVAWLRLAPELSPRQRTIRPHLWVSHRSAARLLDLGVVPADVPEFISDRRLQSRADVRVRVRSEGLEQADWMIHDGFAVTTPARTIADLVVERMDGGHLGRIASDAVARGLVSRDEIQSAVGGRVDVDSIIEQAAGKVR